MNLSFSRPIACTLATAVLLAASPARADIPGRAADVIPAQAEIVYQRGLEYLAKNQNEKGSWNDSTGSEPGVVGLCVAAFLAHGEDPVNGPYAKNIRNGIDFILSEQNESNGYIGSSMYNHAFATKALAEAYGVLDDPRIAPALKKAVDLILSSQKRNRLGAWRYTPDSRDGDTTVTGCQIVTLFAARNAGLAVPAGLELTATQQQVLPQAFLGEVPGHTGQSLAVDDAVAQFGQVPLGILRVPAEQFLDDHQAQDRVPE